MFLLASAISCEERRRYQVEDDDVSVPKLNSDVDTDATYSSNICGLKFKVAIKNSKLARIHCAGMQLKLFSMN
eukprot:1724838-Pleurochrysis_carterae.AAC.1